MTSWEVFSLGRMPYAGTSPADLIKLLDKGSRLSQPTNVSCSDEMWVFICINAHIIQFSCLCQKHNASSTCTIVFIIILLVCELEDINQGLFYTCIHNNSKSCVQLYMQLCYDDVLLEGKSRPTTIIWRAGGEHNDYFEAAGRLHGLQWCILQGTLS